MGKNAPDPAPAPDPYATARAQTSSNVDTAIANTVLGNANETSPLGTVRYQQNGSYSLSSPVLDANGAPTTTRRWVSDGTGTSAPYDPSKAPTFGGGGEPAWGSIGSGDPWGGGTGGHWVEDPVMTTRDIPIWERIVQLSPEQQQLYDKQLGVQNNLMDLATTQSAMLRDVLGRPINLDGLPEATTDFSADRARVEAAMFDRLRPQLDQSRASLEDKLVNQGFSRNTQAFRDQMDQAARDENDARTAIILAGGQEQSRLAALQGTARERALQERLAARSAPINEISALLGQSQVQMPQFTPFQAGSIANTPVGDYVYKSADINQKNAQIAAQQAAATNGGLFGLGSSVIGGLFKSPMFLGSDIRLKEDIRPAGALANGLPLYSFRYKGQTDEQIGLIAQEVEKVRPEAVVEIAGVKLVNYQLAVQ